MKKLKVVCLAMLLSISIIGCANKNQNGETPNAAQSGNAGQEENLGTAGTDSSSESMAPEENNGDSNASIATANYEDPFAEE